MTKINVLTLERFVDALTVALGEAGVVHLVDAVSVSPHRLLEGVSRREDIDALQGLQAKCEYVSELVGVSLGLPDDAEVDDRMSLGEATSYLDDLLAAYQSEDEAINRLISESGTLAQRYDQLDSFPFRKIQFGELRDLNFLYMETGRMAPHSVLDVAQALGEKALVLREQVPGARKERVMILTSRKNRFAAESELKKGGFEPEALPGEDAHTALAELERVKSSLADVKAAIEHHRAKIILLAEKNRSRLVKIHASVNRALVINRAKEKFGRAASLYCVSGWIPARREQEIRDVVDRTTGGTAIVESNRASERTSGLVDGEKVPVQMPEVGPLKPFQSLVTGFGAPRYGDLEPSLFVAITFVFMFGIMFGDVGQGMVLVGGGLYMLLSRNPFVRRFATHGYFLVLCGLSATLFGFLYGSVFGYEGLLPHIWLSPLENVMTLLLSAVVVGVLCISVGMLINIYNRLRAKDYYEGLLANFGMLGALFYWGAIGLAVKAYVRGRVAPWEVVVLIGLPLLIMFFREPLYNLLTRRRLLHEDPLTFVMTSGIEILETVMSFLGNTVSFARVGAFALSHAALCFAIYAVVESLRGAPASGVLAFVVIVLGNAFVILLEGLVVTIQGIRLQYYELFSKYFPGDGVLYQPFTTHSGKQAGADFGNK